MATDALLTAITRAHERPSQPRSRTKWVWRPLGGLSRALSAGLYPSAHKLIMWGRLIVAAALMDGMVVRQV